MERIIEITYKELVELLKYGKTLNKFDLNVYNTEYDAENESVITGVETTIDYIIVKED